MKKIIALALALIMALSMASVAFAADYVGKSTVTLTGAAPAFTSALKVAPGSAITLDTGYADKAYNNFKISYDFTTGSNCGASMIDSIKLAKNKADVVVTLKESYTMMTEKELKGVITLTNKDDYKETITLDWDVNNNVVEVVGEKKAANAINIGTELWAANDTIFVMDEDGGYVKFFDAFLTGVVKMDKDEKAFVSVDAIDADTQEAIEEALGEDYVDEAIIEYYVMNGKGFKNEVAFTYEAYAEDPHFFYLWDGEKFVDLEGKFNDDEDVEAYEFSGTGAGVLVITDVEIVAAAEEETKNPDTGANDVVGVAAALAVVSLVAAGAVSLKK